MKIAFKMRLNPGCADEYKKRHDEIWPELTALLKKNGILDYAIFLDEETNTLFAVQTTEDSLSSQDISIHPVMKRWWDYVADIMETNPDNSPVVITLVPMFNM